MGAIKRATIYFLHSVFLALYLVFYDQMLQIVVLRQLKLAVVDAFTITAIRIVTHGHSSRKF